MAVTPSKPGDVKPETKQDDNTSADLPETKDLKVTGRAEDRIDPRLDNRRDGQRPPLETFPAKPQQIDGPELGDPQPRPGERVEEEDGRPRKGMKSPGPHGLGDTADQV